MNETTTKSRRKNRRRVFIFLALAIGVFGALFCTEVALRLYVASRGWTANCYVTGLVFFVPDAHAGHTLRPGLRLRSSTYDVTVNAHGLRGSQIALPKPSKTSRIAVLGGSSVFGYLVPDGEDSCGSLQEMLRLEGRQVEVLNAGVPGYNMTQCRHRFEQQIVPLDPDIVILYLGWNDVRFLISADPSKLDKTPPAPPWLQRTLARSVLYGFVRYRLFPPPAPQFAPPPSAETRVTELGAQSFQTDYRALVQSIVEAGAVPVISTQVMAANPTCQGLDAYLGSELEQIDANRQLGQWICNTVRSIADEEQVLLVDCAADVPCNQEVLGDAIHLTAVGHRLVAARWAEALGPKLDELSDVSSGVNQTK